METRVYKSVAARKSALTQILKHHKFNYVVVYRSTRGPAMQLANAAWVRPGKTWVDF